MEAMKTTNPCLINQAGYDLLVNSILKPSHVSVTKTPEQLLIDEVKRHILLCIEQNFKVGL